MKNFSLHAILPCFLLLAFSILQASAQQAVLNRPVTVAVQDGTFSEAAGQIERQTGLMFLYKSDDIDRNRKISLNVRNARSRKRSTCCSGEPVWDTKSPTGTSRSAMSPRGRPNRSP